MIFEWLGASHFIGAKTTQFLKGLIMPNWTFQQITFSTIYYDQKIWLQISELAVALGYSDVMALEEIYKHNAEEFTESTTRVLNNEQTCNQPMRLFSLHGCLLLGMFVPTTIAKEFRKWVLNMLDETARVDPLKKLENMLEKIGARYPALNNTAAYEAAMKIAEDLEYRDISESHKYYLCFQNGKVILRWLEPRFYFVDIVELADQFTKLHGFIRSNDVLHIGKSLKKLDEQYQMKNV